MASWQAHLLSGLCKFTIKRPLRKSPTVATIRRVFAAAKLKVPRGCNVQDATIGGVRGEWMTAPGVPQVGTMLYLHGGAYIACSPVSHRPLIAAFARQGWRVFAPDYRLAPEHPFPAAIDDAVAAYRGLVASIDPKQLVVAGDSAGGNLTLALCLSLRTAGVPQPAALALFSPVTDFTWSGSSIRANSERCAMFTHEVLPMGTAFYLNGHNPRDPLASPLFAPIHDLHNLPPMLFHASSDEILCDDSVRMAERVRAAGLEVEIATWPVVPHVWQLLHDLIPEGRESLRLTGSFLLRHVNP
ncbi:MAG TPA: alpha/beta hydrolase [Steroidobacteraceae bacterium]|nr:alpha/beta hydrolase [Steroidobacteraceae bacterium]